MQIHVDRCRGYAFLCGLKGCLSPPNVDLIKSFGGVGQDGDLLGHDFHEAAADGDEAVFPVLDYANLARLENGQQPGVAR